MSDYTILICPVCGEQAEPGDYEYGPSVLCSHDREFPTIEPIEVAVADALDPAWRVSRFGLERFRLNIEKWQQQLDRIDAAARREYLLSLTDAELEEELGAMGAANFQMGETMRRVWATDLERQLYSTSSFLGMLKKGTTVRVTAGSIKPKARRS